MFEDDVPKKKIGVLSPRAAIDSMLKANTALHNAWEILFQRPRIKAEVQTGYVI